MSNPSLHKALLHKAVQLLAQRSHSSYELKNKLLLFCQKKFVNQEYQADLIQQTINQVIDECLAKKWLNEDDFIEQYVAMRARKGYGKNRIIFELKQRGIVDDVVLTVISRQDIDWIDIGFKQMIKKFRTIDKQDLQQKAKIFQFLSYKGFSQEQIHLIYLSVD